MTPISLIVAITKANHSKILMLNDYYVQCAIRLNQSTQKILTVNSKRIFGQLFLNANNGKMNINPNIQLRICLSLS